MFFFVNTEKNVIKFCFNFIKTLKKYSKASELINQMYNNIDHYFYYNQNNNENNFVPVNNNRRRRINNDEPQIYEERVEVPEPQPGYGEEPNVPEQQEFPPNEIEGETNQENELVQERNQRRLMPNQE